jgi:hypothetical protein
MAQYDLRVFTVRRAEQAAGAVYVAREQAGDVVWNGRASPIYKSVTRDHLRHEQIVLPSKFASDEHMGWARNRTVLWDVAELADSRKHASLARGYEVPLPAELADGERRDLTLGFARALADRYGNAVDVAIHGPNPARQRAHHHARLLTTTRVLTRDNLIAKIMYPSNEGQEMGQIWSQHVESALGLAVERRNALLGKWLLQARAEWSRFKQEALLTQATVQAKEGAQSLEHQDDHSF